jgi:hypothetical protein
LVSTWFSRRMIALSPFMAALPLDAEVSA